MSDLPFRESMAQQGGGAGLGNSMDAGQLLADDVGPPEIPPEEVVYSERDLLGRGAFGSVYRGQCRGKKVAIKVPIEQDMDEDELETFRNEVSIMRKTFHPNICLFLGACIQEGNIKLVSELMQGDVEELLASKEGRLKPMHEKVRMAKDAALGINWLHGIVHIIHRDLKPANLLLDVNGVVKVTDFGFSTLKRGNQQVRDTDGEAKGTALYMAPEVMLQKDITFKIDVYAFGLMMWEFATCQELFPEFEDYDEFYDAIVEEDVRPPVKGIEPRSYAHLMQRCWARNPDDRPTMKEVIFRLDECIVDAVITVEEGRSEARNFWKENYLLPRQTLFEQVNWLEFSTALSKHIGADTKVCSALAWVTKGDTGDPDDREAEMSLTLFAEIHTWFGPFFAKGGVGANITADIAAVVSQLWFHGTLSKTEAELRLNNRDPGTFLVRLSSTTPGCPFTITSMGDNGKECRHRRVSRKAQKEGGGLVATTRNGPVEAKTLLGFIEDNMGKLGLKTPCTREDPKTAYTEGYE